MNQVQIQEVVGPGMRKLLVVVLVLFAILIVDSVLLATVTFVEWRRGIELQNMAYQSVFLVHLALGFLITAPALVFAVLHLRRAIGRPKPAGGTSGVDVVHRGPCSPGYRRVVDTWITTDGSPAPVDAHGVVLVPCDSPPCRLLVICTAPSGRSENSMENRYRYHRRKPDAECRRGLDSGTRRIQHTHG